MSTTSFLFQMCQKLFADYPLAVGSEAAANPTMILALFQGDAVQFSVLAREAGGEPSYSLRGWSSDDSVQITPSGRSSVPDAAAQAVVHGTPVPRDGSLFGWKHEDAISALIPVYAEFSLGSPNPTWSVMPLAHIPEIQWPPFTGQPAIGGWFWEHYRCGRLVILDALVGSTADVVFWADTEAVLGWDSCVVMHDVQSPEGWVLPAGHYVYYRALRSGTPVPPLEVVLAGVGKTDLAPWFEPAVCPSS